MREIKNEDIYNLYVKKESNIILNLDSKITLDLVLKLKIEDLEKHLKGSDYSKILNLDFFSVYDFLEKFKEDCKKYMINEFDNITINSYFNFLEETM